MSTRQRRLAAVTVGIGCAAIAGGIAVTAQAMATDGAMSTSAQVGIVSVAGDGSDPFQCTFDDVDLGELLPEGVLVPPDGEVGTVVAGGSAAIAVEVPEQGTVSSVFVEGQSATDELAPLPALEGTAGGMILGQSQIREGTEEECTTLREQGLLAGPSGAVGATGQSQLDIAP